MPHSIYNFQCRRLYKGFSIKSGAFSIAEPTRGKNTVEIDENITFHVDVKFAKSKNAWKVLSTLAYKSITQQVLSHEEVIDLLVLPDMDMGEGDNMKLPIGIFMMMVIDLMGKVKFPSLNLKIKVFLCEKMVLARFFVDEKLVWMIGMLKDVSKDSEIARKLDEYGLAYGGIYLDGRSDGFADAKLEDARKLLARGVDEDIISDCTGISVDELVKIKREL